MTPRLRLFAGPNGSGKSVLKMHLPTELLGVYLNPDEIEAAARTSGGLDLAAMKVDATASVVLPFFKNSAFLKSKGLEEQVGSLRFNDGWLDFSKAEMNSYFASVTVDFLRQWYLRERVSFTFEALPSRV